MAKRVLVVGAVIISVLMMVAVALNEVPHLISFQSTLYEEGNPVTGTVEIIFRIYDDPWGPTILWEETDSVECENGLYNVILGRKNPIDLDFDGDFWLGTQVKGDPNEMIPRYRLVSVPAAIRAEVAEEVSWNNITDIPAGFADGIDNGGSANVIEGDFTITGKITIGQMHTNTGGSAFVAGFYNEASGELATVGGGADNVASEQFTTVGGGGGNEAISPFTTIPGGHLNYAQADFATVGGGHENNAEGENSVVAGGSGNIAGAVYATVSGGYQNNALGENSVIAGGSNNTTSVDHATVSGGCNNVASGNYATVAGGYLNTAHGDYSFAAGYNAEANHASTFVWACSTATGFSSTKPNQFLIQASGVGIGTNDPNSKLHVSSARNVDLLIEADRNNGNSFWQPTLTLSQEGGDVTGQLGYFDGTKDLKLVNNTPMKGYVLIKSNGNVRVPGNIEVGSDLMLKSNEIGMGWGAEISLKNGDGDVAIVIDAQDELSDRAIIVTEALKLKNKSGDETIYIDANYPNAGGKGCIVTEVLKIKGGSDLSEQFEVSVGYTNDQPLPGMVVCIDPEHPGELIVSSKAYDHTVAGIVSGAGGLNPGMLMSQSGSAADGEHPVALSGRVYCLADASYGPIKPGNLLTTSDTPGHAMAATDRDRAYGAVIGKSMTGLEEDRGLVLVLVTLQ